MYADKSYPADVDPKNLWTPASPKFEILENTLLKDMRNDVGERHWQRNQSEPDVATYQQRASHSHRQYGMARPS